MSTIYRCLEAAPHPPHRRDLGAFGVKTCPGVPRLSALPLAPSQDRDPSRDVHALDDDPAGPVDTEERPEDALRRGTWAARRAELESLRAERDRYRETLGEMLGKFRFHGYPGNESQRSDWVKVSTVERWRAVLAEPARESSGEVPPGSLSADAIGWASVQAMCDQIQRESGWKPPDLAEAAQAGQDAAEDALRVALADDPGEAPVRAFPAITDDDRRAIYTEADAARLAARNAYPAPRAVIVAAMDAAIDATDRLVRERIAYEIRRELVCCDVYDRDAGTERAGREHPICFWGEGAARLAEGRTDG